MGGAALVSGSRGGVVAVLATLFAMVALVRHGQSGAGRIRTVALLAGLVILVAFWIGHDVFFQTAEHLAEEVSDWEASPRLRIWEDSVVLIRSTTLIGTGLATFGSVFPIVQTVESPHVFTHAESDWVQLSTDTGTIGLGFVLAVALTLGIAIIRLRQSSRGWTSLLAIGAASAMFGTLVQGIGNFNLPLMSGLMYLATIISTAVRIGVLGDRQDGEAMAENVRSPR